MERNFISEAMLGGWYSTFKIYLFKPIVKHLTSPTSVGLFFQFLRVLLVITLGTSFLTTLQR